MCPFSSWVLCQAALEMSKINAYNIGTKPLTCCLCFWTSISAGVTQSGGEEGPWLGSKRILSLLGSFSLGTHSWCHSLWPPLACVFPVLLLLVGAVSWGEDQYGTNLLGCPVMAEILKSKNKNRQGCIRRKNQLLQTCYASLAVMSGGCTAEISLCCPVTSIEFTPVVRNCTGISQLAS